jgi:hypothetical protein
MISTWFDFHAKPRFNVQLLFFGFNLWTWIAPPSFFFGPFFQCRCYWQNCSRKIHVFWTCLILTHLVAMEWWIVTRYFLFMLYSCNHVEKSIYYEVDSSLFLLWVPFIIPGLWIAKIEKLFHFRCKPPALLIIS